MNGFDDAKESALATVGITCLLVGGAAFFFGGLVTFFAVANWMMENVSAWEFGLGLLAISGVCLLIATGVSRVVN